MRNKWIGAALLASAFGVGCVVPATTTVGPPPPTVVGPASIAVQNASSFDIYRLFMSSSSDPNWGPDLLGTEILSSGSTFTLTMPCDTYDIKIVDEDEDECTVMGVALCSDHAWVLTDQELLSCEGYM